MDCIMFILAVLTLLVTVLIGWNIYTVIRYKEDVKRITIETVTKIIKENYLTDEDIKRIIES